MSENKQTRLINALKKIGHDKDLRDRFVSLFHKIEEKLSYENGSVRDDITGPMIDALFDDVGVLQKELKNGMRFDYHYRSKIARDFVMAPHEKPSHVWEPQTTKLLLYLSSFSDHVVVGGAYFGDQALIIAQKIALKGGTCHAFEPNPDQFEMLQHNAKLNDLKNLNMWRVGLWRDSTSRMKLVGDDSFAHPELVKQEPEVPSNSPDQEEAMGFSTIAIDDYLKREGIAHLGLIMLDIEGAEHDVLLGAEGQLKQEMGLAPNIVFEIHRSYSDWSQGLQNTAIVKYLTSFGYSVYAVRDFNSNVEMKDKAIEIIPPESTYLDGPPHGFNMLAVKDKGIIENGPFRICSDVSPKLLRHKNPMLHHPINGL